MRSLLFRAKKLHSDEWLCGYYCRFGWTGEEESYVIPQYASACTPIEVDSDTVGQYTGLIDKNGMKIFEGDIVSIPFEEDRSPYEENCIYYENAVVYFDTKRYGWYVKFSDEDELSLWEYDETDMEVIGNIHNRSEKEGEE